MAKTQLKTEFVCIATAGATVDGRVISEQDLFDMAESYNPETYQALIWLEHYRWFGNLGEVLGLKAEKVGDKVKLFAELRPTAELVELNQNSQKVFTSIEIMPNFANTGKAYLGGLAVTDSPASTGTTRLNFSARGIQPNCIIGNHEPFHFSLSQENGKEGFINALIDVFSKFTGNNSEPKPHIEPTFSDNNNNKQENQTMTEEQMQKFAVMVATAVAAQFNQQPNDKPADPEPTQAEEVKTVSAEEFNSLQAKFNELEEKFNALAKVEVTQTPTGEGNSNVTKFHMAI
ncbi:GPO family capsid scaffolding protein [Ursidibacter sp. B-7004-1]